MYRQFNIWFSSSAIVVGVATFCKASATPVEAEEGLYKELNPKLEGKVGHYGDVSEFSSDELEALDAEGRAVITKHKIRWKKVITVHMKVLTTVLKFLYFWLMLFPDL